MAATLWLPVRGWEPFQPPLAAQVVALVEDHVRMTGCPTNALAELGEKVTVGGEVTTAGGAGEGVGEGEGEGEGEPLLPQPTRTTHSHGMVAEAKD